MNRINRDKICGFHCIFTRISINCVKISPWDRYDQYLNHNNHARGHQHWTCLPTSWLIQLLCVSVKNLNNCDSWRHPRKKHICNEIIPLICRGSHGNTRVKFFWPVQIFTDLTRKIGNLLCKFWCKFYFPKILLVYKKWQIRGMNDINDNCATVKTNPIHHQVEAAFSRFDISGDEQLDYKEFCNMMNARDKSKRKSREQSRGERRK